MARFTVFACALALCFATPAVQAKERYLDVERYGHAIEGSVGHPNELYRWYGLWNLDNGRSQEAIENLQRAAYYGDKLSQHLLSLMYWNGEGVGRDPVAGYIWADLAAERGTSAELIAARETMWNALTPAQQQQVLQQGPGYNQRYGDAVAQRRTNAAIGQFKRARTGTHTGSEASPLVVRLGTPRLDNKPGGTTLDMSQMVTLPVQDFYGAARTNAVAYWSKQDEELDALVRMGHVDLGPAQKVRQSRTP